MQLKLLTSAAAALLPWSWTAEESSPHHDILDQEISKWVTAAMQEWDIPGLSVAVVRTPEHSKSGKWQVEARGYGVRNSDGEPATDKTLMAVGSNSKLFTAIAAGLLVENTSIPFEWETKVADVIPDFHLWDDIATRGTNLIDLLGHRTGVPRHDSSYGKHDKPIDVIRNLRNLKPSAEFREHWQYNNMMYTTASFLPETLAGVPFQRYVRENILKPLNMTETFYDVKEMQANGHLSDGYAAFDRNMTQCHVDFRSSVNGEQRIPRACLGSQRSLGYWLQPGEEDGIAGAGGVAMSANDMAKWLQMLLSRGKAGHDGRQAIPASVIAACAAARSVPLPGQPTMPEKGVSNYGMAQIRYSYRGYDLIEHGGSVTGFKSQIARLPELGLGVAITANTDQYGTPFVELVKNHVIDRVLGVAGTDWSRRLQVTTFNASLPDIAMPPSNPRLPAGGLSRLVGKYSHDGYGPIELCDVDCSATNASRHCQDLLGQAPPIKAKRRAMISKVDSVWADYLILTHFDGGLFNVTTALVAPSGEVVVGEALEEGATVLFAEHGFGINKIWGPGPGVKDGDFSLGVEKGSEVYFRRL